MAAAAAAAISSSFTTPMQSLKCIRFKINWHSDPIKFTSKNMLQVASIPHSLGVEPTLMINMVSQKCRARRLMAAVAQEEVALTTEAETEEVQEAEEVEAVTAEAEAVTAEAETEEVQEAEEVEAVTAEAETEEVQEEAAAEVETEEVQGEEEETSGGDESEVTPTVNTKLYFGNLPYLCDSAQLAGIIQDYGSPELVEVLYDRNTGRSRGFAFVTMSTVGDCKAVIENLDGSVYGGRTLRVNFADKPKPKEPLYPETEHKLFVGNLSWSVTSESLTQAFQEYGNVVGARVLYDGETGRSRGYGFVCFPTKSEMESALQALDGVELDGRSMRVSLAQGKRQ